MTSPSEFQTTLPAVFQRPDLSSLVYAETRRASGKADALSGNLGVSLMIVGEENYARTGSGLPYAEWKTLQLTKAANRLMSLKELTQLDDIAYLRLPHGTDLINLDGRLDEVSLDTPFEKRTQADSSTSTKDGVGSLLAVGDCAPINVVFPGAERIAQMHIGIRGAAKELIPLTFQRLATLGHDPKDATVFVGPHAHQFQMNRTEFEELNVIISQGSDEVKKEYLMNTQIGPSGYPILDLSRFVLNQLERSGVLPAEIELSPINTLSNKSLFSNYTTVTTGVPDGRFGSLLGKRSSS